MKRILLLSVVSIFAILVVSGCVGQTQQTGVNETSPNYTIIIKNSSFNPSTITVEAGVPVVWINQDSVSHTVTFSTGTEKSSDILSPGQNFTHYFNTRGTFNYHCSIHTFMTGAVIVE